MEFKTAGTALEPNSTPIALFRVPTMGASTGGVPWVYEDDIETPLCCLVRYELLQLAEWPPISLPAGLLADRAASFSDTGQILQSNRWATHLCSKADNLFGDAMIQISEEPSFLPPQPFLDTPQAATVLLCPSGLKRSSSFQIPLSYYSCMSSMAKQGLFPVCGDCHDSDASVHPDYRIIRGFNFQDFLGKRHQQIDLLSLHGKERSPHPPSGEKLSKFWRPAIPHPRSSIQSGDGYNPFVREELEITAPFPTLKLYRLCTEPDRHSRRPLQFPQRCVLGRDCPSHRSSNLGRKPCLAADSLIALRLKGQCAVNLLKVKGYLRGNVTAIRKRPDNFGRFFQGKVNQDFGCSYQFHQIGVYNVQREKSTRKSAYPPAD